MIKIRKEPSGEWTERWKEHGGLYTFSASQQHLCMLMVFTSFSSIFPFFTVEETLPNEGIAWFLEIDIHYKVDGEITHHAESLYNPQAIPFINTSLPFIYNGKFHRKIILSSATL